MLVQIVLQVVSILFALLQVAVYIVVLLAGLKYLGVLDRLQEKKAQNDEQAITEKNGE